MQFGPRLFDAEDSLHNPDMFNKAANLLFDDLSWWAHVLRAARLATETEKT
jgi:hypothetical protein